MERNTYSETEAKQRIASQMPLADKCERSHFVVDNSASLGETRKQVDKIFTYLKSSNHHIQVRFYLAGCVAAFSFVFGLLFFLFYRILINQF